MCKAENAAHTLVPVPLSDELASGPKQDSQNLPPMEFLAEFTQHISAKVAHLIRYYDWYSNKARM